MSAAPQPTPVAPEAPDDQAAADAEGWALLEALRRKLDDQAAQGRKTQQQVGQLAESIGALVAEQRRRSRWLNLNSFVAYVLFTVVVGAGFFLLYRSRANELLAARDHAQAERDLAVRRADEAGARATARDEADTRAWEVYQLLEAGQRTEAAAKLATLSDVPLSRTERAVLAARAHATQVMEVDATLKAAAASFRAGRYAEVIAPLEAALVSEPAGARAALMRYYLGVAYAKGNDLAKAIPHLQQAVWAEVDQDDARFQLASALDRSGQYAKARVEYDRFASASPRSTHAAFAMRRSATLARMPAVAPATAPAAASTAIAPKVAPAGGAPTGGSSSNALAPGATMGGPGSGAASTPTAPDTAAPKPATPKPAAPTTPATAAPATEPAGPAAAP
ncbi:MAG TPA: tetratricopeptide repeat protein [Kofleriaceae bacterium]|nr:tetratricopeptide repeat protein [Kofleriaceae bacterium]